MTNSKPSPVDVVVVGAGVAGTIICKELAQTGLRVVALERGRMINPAQDFAMPYAHDELKYERFSDILQNLSRETITFRNAMSETALPMREMGSFKLGECVGGAGVIWGASAWRFLPWDFETRSRTEDRYGRHHLPEDCISSDWGITYDELEPYYDQFEHIYGVGGKAGNLNGELQPGGNPYEGPRSREYPNPPHRPTASGLLFEETAAQLGFKPFPTPAATMSQPYTNPYRLSLGQCVHGGFCSGQGCAVDAKATPLTTVVPALFKHENFELRTRANVIKINLDSTKKRATGVTYIDGRGRHIEQPAELVILTSFVFSNTRLMLLSGIGQPYDPIANRGQVGRNYAYETGGKVSVFFDDRKFKRYMGGGGHGVSIDEFNGDNFDHSSLGFIGGAHISAHTFGAKPIRSHPVPPGTPRWGSGWKKAVTRYYDSAFQVTAHGGCQSYRTRYMDLDPTYRDVNGMPLLRLTFDWHEHERKLSAYLTNQTADICRAMGASITVPSALKGKYSIVPYQSTHNTGGVPMGSDPATSAVNKYLQSWDVHNVFVVGASAFPQNSSNNPTGTVGALACWTADAIKDLYLKRPGQLL